MRPLIYWHICNLALCVGQDSIAARPCPESAGCSSGSSADDLLHIEPPAALQGEILLQAKQSRSKVAPADAPNFSQTEKVGDGKEHVEGAIADVVHGAGATNRSGRPVLRAASHEEIEKLDRRAMSGLERPFQVTPPLKEPAARADENYKHDKQISSEVSQSHQASEPISVRGPISVKDAMEVAVSVILLGFVVLVMTSFYLVNWPNQDIQQATWRLFSTTTSVFLAVLLFSGTQEVMGFYKEARGLPHDHDPGLETSDHGPVSTHVLILIFLRYLGLLIGLQVLLFFVDTKDIMLHGLSRLGSHIVAFAGIDVFAALQASEVYPFWMHPDRFTGFLFSVLIVWGLFDVAEFVRWRVFHRSMHGDGRIDKARQEWFAECREGEHEAAGLILGLLLSQHVRHALTGIHAPLHGGAPQNKSLRQVVQLFVIGLLLGVMVVPIEMGVELLSRGLSEFTGRINWKYWSARLIRICRETLAMTMAWCFLYWGHWQFWYMTEDRGLGWGSQISATLSIAIILSTLCFSGIFVIEFVLDALEMLERTQAHQAGFVALGKSLGLVMGLGWETCFREAIKGASRLDFERFHADGGMVTNMILIGVLCLIVLPAWLLFVHPKSLVNRRDDFLNANLRAKSNASNNSKQEFEG
mmetsp:Transcript_32626/g.59351  ORF Transcript_32626/g.59351 Transcript_32626/m.59351 type:complete len:642 (+) Transcript_32626:78-2003(+)